MSMFDDRAFDESYRTTAEAMFSSGTGSHSSPAQALKRAHAVFQKWLGADYDVAALDAVLAAAAVERLDGDPLWLLLISGPGNAKTETVQALDGIGAVVTSTISSAGGLLSATPKREREKDATGGLLRRLEPGGVLVVKDVTSILSMSGDARAEVFAALREVYDGRWSRNVGTDGGKTLDWRGRIAMVGAVTTAWDKAHGAVSAMGDRYVLIRMDSRRGRYAAGRQAIANTGSEIVMRAELSDAVTDVIDHMDTEPIVLDEAESEALLAAADLVTLARTGVEYDYRGDVTDAHAPEMPTRFAKQLAQVVRGAVAVGVPRAAALRLAIRCARDSVPPLRLGIIDDLSAHPHSTTTDVRRRLDQPRNTVDRQLQALHMLGVCTVDEQEYGESGKSRWFYSLADEIRPGALANEKEPNSRSTSSGTVLDDPSEPGQVEPAIATSQPSPSSSTGLKTVPDSAGPTPRPQRRGVNEGLPMGPALSGKDGGPLLRLAGNDRCPSCSFHIPTQGHRDACPDDEQETTK
ncbi:ArsR family transcriptional regulator [Mycolicibacterium grossiae]|uniref:ArsR family transcriptional regulator n=1 Tax=Mycolicibacterium grossiae TaxID=1552759 RepID=UPI001FECCB70|nr:ArsR family transcriptional regulator [Mycolicibacterium grossiae]